MRGPLGGRLGVAAGWRMSDAARRPGWARVAAALACLIGTTLGAPDTVSAQAPFGVRTGVIVEDYSVDPGLSFESIRQMTIPVVAEVGWGARAQVTLASGWTEVRMGLADGTERSLSGVVDSEARLRVALVRDRLDLIVTGSVPSGTGSLSEDDIGVVAPLGNDLWGFATPSLGAGGSVGVGVVGAGSAGSASVGWGIHGRLPLSYEPVLGGGDEVRAGAELRLRGGFESPLGRRSFVRAAVVASFRQQDQLNGRAVNRVGHRVAGYLSVDVPIASAVATAWTSGLYRADPALEPTAVGAAFVPRGYFAAAGTRLTLGLGSRTRFVPEFEFRTAASAPDATAFDLESLGDVIRVGAQLRRGWGRAGWLVAEGHSVFGSVSQDDITVDTRGFRAALFVEWTR